MAAQETLFNSRVPASRVVGCNRRPVRSEGRFVLYWMRAFRRAEWNFSLDRAVEWARQLQRPLVVLETLPCDARWASLRHHRFVLDGMADTFRRLERSAATYHPYVESKPGQSMRLAAALAREACLVLTDDYPMRAAAEELSAAASQWQVFVEKVDSNGLLPMRLADRAFPTAFAFRRFLQRALPDHLPDVPLQNALSKSKLPRLGQLPPEVVKRWPPASSRFLKADAAAMARLPVNRNVEPAATTGGARAATATLRKFLSKRLPVYAERRNDPQEEATSGLSPYLHFGHVSVHEIFRRLAEAEGWSPDRLAERAGGSREGWWGMSEPAEAFLDELVTWREVGFNMCAQREDYDRFESLPDWAGRTLAEHAKDRRQNVYSLAEFESAATHDPLWNAAQTQLVREGRMHNYLRMLWGKKILEWTPSPRDALEVMIELNNKFALDGDDPNSYSGIFWVLGRYDRPWGPERPVFGKIRYMSSENTARKFSVDGYIEKYA